MLIDYITDGAQASDTVAKSLKSVKEKIEILINGGEIEGEVVDKIMAEYIHKDIQQYLRML